MLSSKRPRARPAHVLGPIARVLIIAFAASAAGCSSDITRFAINGPSQTTSSIPVPPEPVGNGYAPGSPPRRGLGLTEAPLPPVSEPPGGPRYGSRDHGAPPPPYQSEPPPRMAAAPEPSTYRPPSYEPTPSAPPGNYRVVGRQYKTPPPQASTPPGPRVAAAPDRSFEPPSATAGGQTIEVQPGETLYSIGRRYGVPPDAIKEANRLSSNVVRPGERLVIPASAPDRGPFAAQLGNRGPAVASAPAAAPFSDRAPASRTATDAAEPPGAEPPPGWTGRHTLRNSESLSAVAARHKVSLDELKRANGITDPAKVWAGTVLHVPEQSAAPVADAGTRAPQTPPRVINATPEPDRRVASRSDVSNDAEPAGAETGGGKFRWPVRGRVIAGFGRRPDGTNNDGVNVAVPQGTEIQAAESGKVVYAGNELKGYGNLVLIRHPNGWVTAYAHADRLLVKANDEVRRGQAIATAGRTGSVDQPQLHFELRQGSRPVDPVPHLVN